MLFPNRHPVPESKQALEDKRTCGRLKFTVKLLNRQFLLSLHKMPKRRRPLSQAVTIVWSQCVDLHGRQTSSAEVLNTLVAHIVRDTVQLPEEMRCLNATNMVQDVIDAACSKLWQTTCSHRATFPLPACAWVGGLTTIMARARFHIDNEFANDCKYFIQSFQLCPEILGVDGFTDKVQSDSGSGITILFWVAC